MSYSRAQSYRGFHRELPKVTTNRGVLPDDNALTFVSLLGVSIMRFPRTAGFLLVAICVGLVARVAHASPPTMKPSLRPLLEAPTHTARVGADSFGSAVTDAQGYIWFTLVVSSDGKLKNIRLENGKFVEREGGFLMDTGAEQATDLPTQLGLSMVKKPPFDEEGCDTNECGETAVKGIYVVGDANSGFRGIIGAAYQGNHCAEMIVQEIISDRWENLK